MGAGAGLVVGSQAGACLAVEAAKDRGLLTAEQIAGKKAWNIFKNHLEKEESKWISCQDWLRYSQSINKSS